ncbi:MAG: hypothetical protein IIB83_08480, partial [Bacteroidetes bacterium]|nr:hypothetical protein [Bacteroidota bacterium]
MSTYLIFLNRLIVENLKKANPALAEDLHLEFEKVDLDSTEDKMAYGPELYNSNIITKNELREILGMKKLEGGDKFAKDEIKPMAFGAPKGNFSETFAEARKIHVLAKKG